jgi:hypothetical protein
MYVSARILRKERHYENKYAHAAEPVREAALEKHTVARRLHVRKDGSARGGKAAYGFKKRVYIVRYLAADEKRQSAHGRHKYPRERNYGKALARKYHFIVLAENVGKQKTDGKRNKRRANKSGNVMPLLKNGAYYHWRQKKIVL